MPNVEINEWRGHSDHADPQRRLLVLPGMSFPITMPLLFIPSVALAEAGWTVWYATWDLSDIVHEDDALWDAVNRAAADLAAAAGDSEGATTVVLGKSVGTLACRWVADANLPAVWLTPLLRDKGVVEHMAATSAPALLIGGTADRSWDRGSADALGKYVVEIPDADHALRSDDWRTYLRTVEHVTDAVLDFVKCSATSLA